MRSIPLTELISYPGRISAHIENCGYAGEVICHVVINGEWKTARKKAIKAAVHRMDARVKPE